MTYILIAMSGFLIALRGSRYAFSQKPVLSFFWIWREAADLTLTLGLIGALFALASSIECCRDFFGEYAVLLMGLTAYLLSRYQKKTDFFFLFVATVASLVFSAGGDVSYHLSRIGVVSIGIALFQTGFLGLRHKLLFARIPESVRGWPVFCLLASFVSLALWGVGRYLF